MTARERARFGLAALLILFLLDGCREVADPTPEGYRTILLRSEDFGISNGRRDTPEARIGLETRPSIESTLTHQLVAPRPRPIRDGVLRLKLPGIRKISSRLSSTWVGSV